MACSLRRGPPPVASPLGEMSCVCCKHVLVAVISCGAAREAHVPRHAARRRAVCRSMSKRRWRRRRREWRLGHLLEPAALAPSLFGACISDRRVMDKLAALYRQGGQREDVQQQGAGYKGSPGKPAA